MGDITRILQHMEQGEPKAADELLPLVSAELRHMAARRMARAAPSQTLQPTALVHEAWLRLVGAEQQTWQNRSHFFGAAAEAMRRIRIERARRKRGNDYVRSPLRTRGIWQVAQFAQMVHCARAAWNDDYERIQVFLSPLWAAPAM
jgi:RNA polymerase sigma factor (TIGR02999 family)